MKKWLWLSRSIASLTGYESPLAYLSQRLLLIPGGGLSGPDGLLYSLDEAVHLILQGLVLLTRGRHGEHFHLTLIIMDNTSFCRKYIFKWVFIYTLNIKGLLLAFRSLLVFCLFLFMKFEAVWLTQSSFVFVIGGTRRQLMCTVCTPCVHKLE